MKGIELSEKFYKEFGAPMIREKFPDLESVIAVGVAGSGSDSFGFDDELSRDHDFDVGFCLFLPGEEVVDRRTCFLLERAYAALPNEFMGVKRQKLSPVGGNRRGVIRIPEFFEAKVGVATGDLSEKEWLTIPSNYLFEATNGKIFRDDRGEFTAIRNKLNAMPEDVRLKKIAGNLIVMGQSGQYNYARCASRGELGGAQFALFEFVKATLNVIFLLNKRHQPYYKWAFRSARELSVLSETVEGLEELILTDNSRDNVVLKKKKVEFIAKSVVGALIRQNLTDLTEIELERHAYAVNDKIKSPSLRNENIFYAV